MATDSFISLSMAMVLQIPQLEPVYSRERANRMYSAATNFLVVWCSGLIVFFIYPVITATLSFSYLEIENQT